MKVAVLLLGYVRTWQVCKQSFIDSFSHLSPDVFVSTYNLQYGHHPHIQGRIGDFSDETLTDEQIYELFKDINAKVSIVNHISDDTINSLHPNFKDIIPSCAQAINLANTLNLLESDYDVVIKTRCDLLYNVPQLHRMTNFKSLDNLVIVDSGNVFPNDCVIISNHTNMRNISTFMMNEFTNPKYHDSHHEAPHRLLYNSIMDNQLHIDKQKLIHSVIRKNGVEHFY